METAKSSFLRNLLVKVFVSCVFIICFRFAYVVTIRGESCDIGDFCFFSLPDSLSLVSSAATGSTASTASSSSSSSSSSSGSSSPPVKPSSPGAVRRDLWTSKDWRRAVHFYSSVFQDLISEGFLSPGSKSLCVETTVGLEVFALREIGVFDSVGVAKKAAKPLVLAYANYTTGRFSFSDDSFDFIFAGGGGGIDRYAKGFGQFASEVSRTLRPEGHLVVHTKSNDTYSLYSFIDLFSDSCSFVKVRTIQGFDPNTPYIREIVMKKESERPKKNPSHGNSTIKCSVAGYKQELVNQAEPLISEEPLKPWLTLKRNIQNIKYLPSMVDISFKGRYVYVDVGARSYGSSIGSWFRKQYPKQNRTFDIYAIEADKSFYEDYKTKKGVNLLPYAAWVKNETLHFEINHDPGDDPEEKGGKSKGMGRIKPVRSKSELASRVESIQGFDFANWLKQTVTEDDFVVMKMDVEGTEFDLIPRLFQTGAICLIDEVFLECHYNRWQRCCPGVRSAKYEKTYGQCLDLFSSLRENGVLVHQWW